MRRRIGFALIVIFSLHACAAGQEVSSTSSVAVEMRIGMNLNAVQDFVPAWVFVDVFQQSRPWISHAFDVETGQEIWGAGGDVALDEQGWPKQLREWVGANGHTMRQRLSTLMFREIGDHFPAGEYLAEWRGTGVVEWGFAAKVKRLGQTKDGRHVALLEVQPSDAGVSMKILSLDPQDHIRDVHVWMPDVERHTIKRRAWRPESDASPFHPLFTDRLRPFAAVRFMDWGNTNQSELSHWAKRPRISDARQTGDNGVAVEYMIALANELDQDAWICLPMRADDEYVRQLAILVRDGLRPAHRVYVEWSNEIWNYAYGFQAARWLESEAKRRDVEMWQVAAAEVSRDFRICREVFHGQEQRLVRVLAGQAANPGVIQEIAQRMHGEFDAIAIAPYIHLSDEQRESFTRQTTARDVIAAARQNLSETLEWVANHQRLAEQYARQLGRPIPLLAYEGGQHLDARGQEVIYLDALIAAQQDRRMKELYAELLRGCEERGVELFMHYGYVQQSSRFGSWGALEYQNAPLERSPKYQALLEAVRDNHAASAGGQ
ncbi:MAG: hypothetical protein KDA60_10560 [Planctomycetales bacterium]|nr:hypothetical protein [Planctomycetales bacterium]